MKRSLRRCRAPAAPTGIQRRWHSCHFQHGFAHAWVLGVSYRCIVADIVIQEVFQRWGSDTLEHHRILVGESSAQIVCYDSTFELTAILGLGAQSVLRVVAILI